MKIGKVIRKWRLMQDLDLRSVGKEIGISAATLLRVEIGHDPSGVTLTKILT